jgi:predicted nucleic acid-binding protein
MECGRPLRKCTEGIKGKMPRSLGDQRTEDDMTIVVSNATALIHLSRINKLSLLKALFSKVIIPRAVYSEVAVPGAVGYEEIVRGVREGWIMVKDVRDRMSVYELTPLLHRGEAEAIVLAEEAKADYLIVDERVARYMAPHRE